MTKNELDKVIEVYERVALAAYREGYQDGLNEDSQKPDRYFKVGPGARMLIIRELSKR